MCWWSGASTQQPNSSRRVHVGVHVGSARGECTCSNSSFSRRSQSFTAWLRPGILRPQQRRRRRRSSAAAAAAGLQHSISDHYLRHPRAEQQEDNQDKQTRCDYREHAVIRQTGDRLTMARCTTPHRGEGSQAWLPMIDVQSRTSSLASSLLCWSREGAGSRLLDGVPGSALQPPAAALVPRHAAAPSELLQR